MNLIFKFFKWYFRKFQYFNKYSTYKKALRESSEYFYPDENKNFVSPKDIGERERVGILPIIIPVLKKKKLRILDYGGGNNPIFSYIKATTNLSVKTDVIEKKKYCKKIEKKIPKKYKKYIEYFSSIDELKTKKFDIICFNSSIQYLENYKKEIIKLKKFNPKYILITRTNFQNEKEDYYTLESIVKDKYHPYIFFSYKKFVKFLIKNKYKLIFSNKYDKYKYKNKFINRKNFCHMDLLFIKNK